MYEWIVPESSGPGVADPNCITFAYYSTVDFIKVSSYEYCIKTCTLKYLNEDSIFAVN